MEAFVSETWSACFVLLPTVSANEPVGTDFPELNASSALIMEAERLDPAFWAASAMPGARHNAKHSDASKIAIGFMRIMFSPNQMIELANK